jgi:hypothetical protein
MDGAYVYRVNYKFRSQQPKSTTGSIMLLKWWFFADPWFRNGEHCIVSTFGITKAQKLAQTVPDCTDFVHSLNL